MQARVRKGSRRLGTALAVLALSACSDSHRRAGEEPPLRNAAEDASVVEDPSVAEDTCTDERCSRCVAGSIMRRKLTVDDPSKVGLLQEIAGVETLVGGIQIAHTELTDLSALRCVREIEGFLYLSYNPGLRDLTGLDRLERIGGEVYMEVNDALADLRGLDSLREIGGPVSIYRHPSLTSLHGLERLGRVAGSVVLADNPNLRDLQALANLSLIESGLTVADNPALEHLGLDAVASLKGVFITGNQKLRTLGLGALERIEGDLAIYSNPSLTDLGLTSLATVTREIHIYENSALPACQAESLAQRLGKTCERIEYGDPFVPRAEIECTGACTCAGNDGMAECR